MNYWRKKIYFGGKKGIGGKRDTIGGKEGVGGKKDLAEKKRFLAENKVLR